MFTEIYRQTDEQTKRNDDFRRVQIQYKLYVLTILSSCFVNKTTEPDIEAHFLPMYRIQNHWNSPVLLQAFLLLNLNVQLPPNIHGNHIILSRLFGWNTHRSSAFRYHVAKEFYKLSSFIFEN